MCKTNFQFNKINLINKDHKKIAKDHHQQYLNKNQH